MTGIETLSVDMIRQLLSCIDEAIHAVDDKGYTIYYNDVAAKHDGLKANEVIGKHILEVFPSLNDETSTLLRVLKTRRAIYDQEQKYENKNGEIIETVNTTIPIIVEGKVKGAVEIAKNYGKIKTLSNKLLDLQSELFKKKKNKNKKQNSYTLERFITEDDQCLRVIAEAKKIATSTIPVVIYGETGTGKEIIAQGIHNASNRSRMPFIAQNCAAIPETLLESVLFGTEKGSYTGAESRPGLLELADGGTLFLDELNSMPTSLQSKLLRILEDGVIRRVGSTNTTTIDVRIVAAMNESPENCLEKGTLRKDFFYRLCTCSLYLPPLRERKMDISRLISVFINELSKNKGENTIELSQEVRNAFYSYDWPGNVRELKNTIKYLLVTTSLQQIHYDDLPLKLQSTQILEKNEDLSLRDILAQKEKKLINEALKRSDGNIVQAAKLLKIPRQTLQYKMSKWQ